MGRIYAIVLAAGRGSRMKSETPKQFMEIGGHEVLWYSLKAMEESCVTDVVVVTAAEYVEHVRHNYLAPDEESDAGFNSDGSDSAGFSKIRAVAAGGDERYDSVYEGLQAILRLKDDLAEEQDMMAGAPWRSDKETDAPITVDAPRSEVVAEAGDIVLIHDGARPMVTPELIARTAEGAAKYQACIPGIPVKDTVRFIEENGSCGKTPDRKLLRAVQTPQAFALNICCEAYEKLHGGQLSAAGITDDAMVVEAACGVKAMFVDGDYRNIKITTPEDMLTAERFLNYPNN